MTVILSATLTQFVQFYINWLYASSRDICIIQGIDFCIDLLKEVKKLKNRITNTNLTPSSK